MVVRIACSSFDIIRRYVIYIVMYTYNTYIALLCLASKITLVDLRASSLKQLGEVGCSPAGNGIPTLGDRETIDVAAMTASLEDVIKTLVSLLVEPRVKTNGC
jgi:hypothetical protein